MSTQGQQYPECIASLPCVEFTDAGVRKVLKGYADMLDEQFAEAVFCFSDAPEREGYIGIDEQDENDEWTGRCLSMYYEADPEAGRVIFEVEGFFEDTDAPVSDRPKGVKETYTFRMPEAKKAYAIGDVDEYIKNEMTYECSMRYHYL